MISRLRENGRYLNPTYTILARETQHLLRLERNRPEAEFEIKRQRQRVDVARYMMFGAEEDIDFIVTQAVQRIVQNESERPRGEFYTRSQRQRSE